MSSNLNALTHGCTSKQKLIKGESEQEWNELKQGWLDDYQPDTFTGLTLALQAFDAEWQLRRAVRRYDEAEQSMPEHVWEWNDGHHKQLERFTRYRTTAERSFHRARNAVEQTRRNREMQAYRNKQLELQLEREAREQKTPKNKKNAEPEREKTAAEMIEEHYKPSVEAPAPVQYINVYVRDGKTRTDVYPTNEELAETIKTDATIKRIFRTIHFHDGLPPEYLWMRRYLKSDGGHQLVSVAEFLELAEHEKKSGTGHLASPLEVEEK